MQITSVQRALYISDKLMRQIENNLNLLINKKLHTNKTKKFRKSK